MPFNISFLITGIFKFTLSIIQYQYKAANNRLFSILNFFLLDSLFKKARKTYETYDNKFKSKYGLNNSTNDLQLDSSMTKDSQLDDNSSSPSFENQSKNRQQQKH